MEVISEGSSKPARIAMAMAMTTRSSMRVNLLSRDGSQRSRFRTTLSVASNRIFQFGKIRSSWFESHNCEFARLGQESGLIKN
jgi:hypothetical protein